MLLNVVFDNFSLFSFTLSFFDAPQTDYEMQTKIIEEADGTYETQSRLIFTATRWENGITIECQTINSVMETRGEIPYRTKVKLQVNCKSETEFLRFITSFDNLLKYIE
ncbi:unnamed protein product [Orchesella dallaii]|uniref:Uncharacterized protein n=1 Tax=Orchesella dallaii TaxID=48710 RepID=A0ABP1QSN9_9HEXA